MVLTVNFFKDDFLLNLKANRTDNSNQTSLLVPGFFVSLDLGLVGFFNEG